MKKLLYQGVQLLRCLALGWLILAPAVLHAQAYSLADVTSYPYPTGLTSAAHGARLAWALNEQGQRNVYVAQGPAYAPRRLTSYLTDDGQELTSLTLSADGRWVLYVRGGDHGGNGEFERGVNASSATKPTPIQLWRVPFAGGPPQLVAEGADNPVLSPRGDQVAFLKGGQVWHAPLDGSAAATAWFTTRGTVSDLAWSPDGTQLAFSCDRQDHALIGVVALGAPTLTWLAPAFARDSSPRWAPDGRHLVFVRQPGQGGVPDSLLVPHLAPWALWIADPATGQARERWHAPPTLAGSAPDTEGGFNLHWAAKNRLVFVSYQDGWPHLYSLDANAGAPLLLTPGAFMTEHISLSADGQWLVFSANTGPDPADSDRRHVGRVAVDQAEVEVLTPGAGLEWTPVVTGDGTAVALLSATAQRPPLPAVLPLATRALRLLGADRLPPRFPQPQLVVPRAVTFQAADGTTVHGQVFEPRTPAAKQPALVYLHGGPPRQMLLGWHYFDYYANAYALNQYLASQGYVVLAVNYRLGIGYGFAFQQAAHAGPLGAAEYQDVRAAGQWLASQPQVDPARIGVYGGSYGGYLTGLALARDSPLFAAGVAVHGVFDWGKLLGSSAWLSGPEKSPDAAEAVRVVGAASPVADVRRWTSPVLLIHGDDDRNVPVSQTTDLLQRLTRQGTPCESLLVVDDTHHWLRQANARRVDEAIAAYFARNLRPASPAGQDQRPTAGPSPR